jgi:Fur family ferric uptake transcriptional regulator
VINGLHETVSARLRAVGQRYTRNRRLLVEALESAGRPLTITETLQLRPLPQSSAYRNLAVLEQAKVVHRVTGGDEFARYELTEELTDHHHHLICTSCGAVSDFTLPPSLERSLEATMADVASDTMFRPERHRLDFIGTCQTCS